MNISHEFPKTHNFYFRFLTAGDFLQLWQHEVKEGASENVSFQLGSAEDSDQETQTTWSCLWKTRPANSIAFLAYSSDGSLFATSGANDRLVRVWYQNQQCKLKFMFSEKATKFCEIFPFFCRMYCQSKVRGRFRKILWPSHNI